MSESNFDTPVDVDPHGFDKYDEMISHLDGAIEEVNYKIEKGRIRDPEKDNTRIKYYRALGYLIRSQLKVLETRDLQLLEERISQLEEEQNP